MKKLLAVTLLGAALTATAAQARDNDTVRIGLNVPYEPMEYKTASGELTGFDVELGNALCQQASMNCQWNEQAWDSLIPSLKSRKIDAIMSAMTINDERRKQLLFSEPYLVQPSAWFAPADSAITATSPEALKGKRIGVQRGTLQDNYVTDEYADANIKRYATADDIVIDIESGRLDLAFLDYPIGKTTMLDQEDKQFKTVGEMVSEPKKYFGDGFGIAFRQRDTTLAEKFNAALDELKENGTYDQLVIKYFGEAALEAAKP
ncbi:transporter substrate-binding domain-containing protein [Phytohalomonas tamaricis]|uniref:transporter substrate-binding domain-containing protein n=1 Tax=Phytohalomonas tamaricis TaxID=2081032 RepID=UPI000D0B9EBA|nr:transporter substrate-binding domain-containing protein [Phytohalomonas tamaricis]